MSLTLDHVFTFNPDGTGKVVLHWEGPGNADADSFVRDEIKNAKGVDGWSGVSCVIDSDRLKFEATAYFKDARELRFHCQGFHCGALDFATSTGKDGTFTVQGTAEAPETPPSKDTETKLRKRITEERAKFEQLKPMLSGLFGGLVATATIVLPGKIGKVANAKKVNDHSVRVEFVGEQILGVLEKLMSDDDLALKFLRAGGGPDAAAGLIEGMGPLKVSTKGKTAVQFDYETEAAAAREKADALAQSVGAPKRREGAPMQNVRIVAAKIVHEADGDREMHPMGQNYVSHTITIAGDLPVPAMSLEEAVVESAITSAGEEIEPEEEWHRRIHFPKLTKERATAFFDVERRPKSPVKGLKIVQGAVRVVVAGRRDDIDLGFKKLAAEESGTKLDAKILSMSDDGERTSFDLALQVSRDAVDDVALTDAKGKRLAMTMNGYSSSGDSCQLSFVVEGRIPPKGKLTAKVAADLQTYDVTWKVENVDATGRPL